MAQRRKLSGIVFVAGAASLGAEIAAARLLAPYFGASTIVWANTIATVLLALSVGYWVGGRMADRRPELLGLCRLMLGAAVALAIVPIVGSPFLNVAVDALQSISVGAAAGSLGAVLVLVAGPVLVLGAAAPYAIRLGVADVREAGSVSGRLYALSTLGSLSGTFLAALVLIPFIGTHRTFLVFALALALVAQLGLPRVALLAPVAIALLLFVPTGTIKAEAGAGRVIYEAETPYQYARVVEEPDGSRRLELNEGLAVHSLWRPGSYLTGDFWDDFLVAPLLARGAPPRRIAILGNAAGTTARAYGHYFPRTVVDAVEIDGELTGIGRRFFDMRGPRLNTITADARPFLRETRRRYDAIFVDAYRQPYIPFYLTTREFFALVRSRLAPGGVLVANAAHPEGSSELERVMSATIGAALPHVVRDPAAPTNTLLIAAARPFAIAGRPAGVPPGLRALTARVRARIAPALRGGPVYTDDRAPVEWLIDRSIVSFAARKG